MHCGAGKAPGPVSLGELCTCRSYGYAEQHVDELSQDPPLAAVAARPLLPIPGHASQSTVLVRPLSISALSATASRHPLCYVRDGDPSLEVTESRAAPGAITVRARRSESR